RIPGADRGPEGVNRARSGLIYRSGEELEAGRYVVTFWGRSTGRPINARFGLTDGMVEFIQLTANWQQFSATFNYVRCDCDLDRRLFQIFETDLENDAWEIAFPQTYKVEPATFNLAVDLPSDLILDTEYLLD